MKLAGWTAAAALLLACSADEAAPSAPAEPSPTCPHDLPASCPAEVPGYAAQIAPILASRCTPGCHSPGGKSSDRPLDSYKAVFGRRGPVLNQIYACAMPPDGAPALSADERALLLRWLICDAPDN